ncbi:cytochrome P450 [Infundibulicybe gibba]|nr:cytochrome P450 [Infundibulicybe gibba]
MLLSVLEFVAVAGIFLLLWKFVRRLSTKSSLDNVPGPPSKSLWTGNFAQLFDMNGWEFHKEIADKYGPVVKINAILGAKELYIFDPKAMRHVLVEDQEYYEESTQFIEANRLMFGDGLLGVLGWYMLFDWLFVLLSVNLGQQHKKQRRLLNPVFSTTHMRDMTQKALMEKVKAGPEEVDIIHWMSRTALELIGQTGLGYSFDPLTDEASTHPYTKCVRGLMPTMFRMIMACTYILPWAVKLGNPRFRRFVVNLLPWKVLHELREMIDVIHDTSTEILESKKRALAEGDEAVAQQIGRGKDIISILIKANSEAAEGDRMSDSEVLGQFHRCHADPVRALIFAAMDTTSSGVSRILSLLAEHPDTQQRLREEILDARERSGGDIPYNDLVSLPYLDAICRESLRLFAPVSVAVRTTRRDMVLPLSNPIKGVDGSELHEVLVPNDTNVIVSIINSNRNPAIWGPDADEWKPERWLKPLPEAVAHAHLPGIYANLMTFLGGGRACIGFKFSQLEMKVLLVILLETFKFAPSGKDVYWQMSHIASPIVKGQENKGVQLPMSLSLVEP